MAGAYVKNLASFVSGTNAASNTITLSASPSPGNMITVSLNSNGTQDITSITDSAGNTYHKRNATPVNVDDPKYADADCGTAPTTVTVNLSAATAQWCVTIDEWSGVTTSQYDGTVFASAHGTASPTSVTPAKAASFIIGVEGHHTGATPASTFTATGAYTKRAQTNKGSGQFDSIVVASDGAGAGAAFSGTLNNSPIGWTAQVFGYQSSIVLTAPVATVSAAGFLGAPAEKANATLATVSAVGGTPAARIIALAPAATVAVVAFPGNLPAGAERFRNRWFRPVVETLSAKWEGWYRYQ